MYGIMARDREVKEWNAGAWCALAVVARKCTRYKVSERCAVADVKAEVDAMRAGKAPKAPKGSRRAHQRASSEPEALETPRASDLV